LWDQISELPFAFIGDAHDGQLPHYSFIEPRWWGVRQEDGTSLLANDQYFDHSIVEGERLIKTVYEALRASPLWEDLLFLITYDEHGKTGETVRGFV